MLKRGDKIIWDSGFGYEVGTYVNSRGVMYGTCLVDLVTGIIHGEVSHPHKNIFHYSDELAEKLSKKYKCALKTFSNEF